MKQVLIEKYGTPWEVARCAEVADVGAPGPDEVVFDVLAFPSSGSSPPTAATEEIAEVKAAATAAAKQISEVDLPATKRRSTTAAAALKRSVPKAVVLLTFF